MRALKSSKAIQEAQRTQDKKEEKEHEKVITKLKQKVEELEAENLDLRAQLEQKNVIISEMKTGNSSATDLICKTLLANVDKKLKEQMEENKKLQEEISMWLKKM